MAHIRLGFVVRSVYTEFAEITLFIIKHLSQLPVFSGVYKPYASGGH